jgi:hypothetical protein
MSAGTGAGFRGSGVVPVEVNFNWTDDLHAKTPFSGVF